MSYTCVLNNSVLNLHILNVLPLLTFYRCFTSQNIFVKTEFPLIYMITMLSNNNNIKNITTTTKIKSNQLLLLLLYLPHDIFIFQFQLSIHFIRVFFVETRNLWKNDDLVVLLTWTQIERIIWNMLYQLKLIHYSLLLNPCVFYVCVCLGPTQLLRLCVSVCACLCAHICLSKCYNKTIWHIRDAFCCSNIYDD